MCQIWIHYRHLPTDVIELKGMAQFMEDDESLEVEVVIPDVGVYRYSLFVFIVFAKFIQVTEIHICDAIEILESIVIIDIVFFTLVDPFLYVVSEFWIYFHSFHVIGFTP